MAAPTGAGRQARSPAPADRSRREGDDQGMQFNSEIFIFVLLPVALGGFYALGARGWRRGALVWLIAASCVFYGWFRADYLPILGFYVVFNYALGRRLACGGDRRALRTWLLGLGIAADLGVLGYYKYTDFFVATAADLAGVDFALHHIILPIGISFFTFQCIAYLVDAHRGATEDHDFVDFALFVSFFPQLVAGPIVHHGETIPQFRSPALFRPAPETLFAGACLFTIGLFKKIVLADQLAQWVDPAFAAAEAGQALSLLESWAAALGFTFQIYFDFSAYTDMALGLALLFGIRLPVNFDSPYKATGIIDFWRRWHMTLSRFLREYVYIPLGGNRMGRGRRYVNLMATMLLGGLWHGAAWSFVAWGALHGLYLVVNHLWRAVAGPPRTGPVAAWSARALTFLAVAVAWVPFRAESFEGARAILAGMAGRNGLALPPGWLSAAEDAAPLAHLHGAGHALVLAGALLIVWALPNAQQWLRGYRPALEPAPRAVPQQGGFPIAAPRTAAIRLPASPALAAGLGAGLVGILVFQAIATTRLAQFIYFQF